MLVFDRFCIFLLLCFPVVAVFRNVVSKKMRSHTNIMVCVETCQGLNEANKAITISWKTHTGRALSDPLFFPFPLSLV